MAKSFQRVNNSSTSMGKRIAKKRKSPVFRRKQGIAETRKPRRSLWKGALPDGVCVCVCVCVPILRDRKTPQNATKLYSYSKFTFLRDTLFYPLNPALAYPFFSQPYFLDKQSQQVSLYQENFKKIKIF
jgi:hypothetical protein